MTGAFSQANTPNCQLLVWNVSKNYLPGDIVTVSFQQGFSMIAQVTRFCIVLLFILSVPAQADVLKMPGDSVPQVASSPDAPERGMNKQQVEQAFGAPHSIEGPTGTPAIYRWNYPGFSVFFEHDYVLHSVVFADQ